MKIKKLIFEENFNYEGKPSPDIWTHEVGPWKPNNELEYYTDRLENCYVKDKKLHIVARKEEYEERHYTSARIKTKNKVDFKYGRIEVKAKVPTGRGCWPAIWMMSTNSLYGNWPRSGEIDIMEFVGGNDYVQSVLHTEGLNHKNNRERIGFYRNFDPNNFHTFTLDWMEGNMKFYVDGNLFYEESYLPTNEFEKWQVWPFDEDHFYLILNLAVGGFLGSQNGIDEEAFPQEFIIDSIKVFEIEA